MGATKSLAVVSSLQAAAAMLEPTRMRLLGELAAPDSASGLARRLGLPRQRVNYHLRELEKSGLVEEVEQRRRGNCVERVVRRAAASFVISPALLGPLAAKVTGGEEAAFTTELRVRFATAQDRDAFAEEASNELSRLVAEYDDGPAAGGSLHRVMIAGYPAGAGRGEPENPR